MFKGKLKSQDKERRSKAVKRVVRQAEDLDRTMGRPSIERSEAMRQAGKARDLLQSQLKNPESAEMIQVGPSKLAAKGSIEARKKLKTAEKTEKQINKLADLSDTIAKNAPKRKKEIRKALRKAAKSRAKK